MCLFGLVALTAEGILFYFTGKTLPDIFTGGFIAMALGPLGSAWVEKYQEAKQRLLEPPEEEEPTPRRGKPSERERGS